MDEAEYCDRISIMNEGRIAALDTPAALKKQYDAGSVDEVFLKIARPSVLPHPQTSHYSGEGSSNMSERE